MIKFQVFWTPSTTNTGDCIWGLQGVSVADGATIDVAFGTAVTVTDAGIGTVEDQQVSAVSGDVTLTNAAVDTQSYFQIFRGMLMREAIHLLACLVCWALNCSFTTDAANDAWRLSNELWLSSFRFRCFYKRRWIRCYWRNYH